jgi:hypothetical protein
MAIDFSVYDLIVAVDSNIILENKPLEQIGWRKIGKFSRVLVVIVPQVSTEIDKFKLNNRLSERVRAFNRHLKKFVKTEMPVELRAKDPQVSLAFMHPGVVDWDALNLDPREADDKVVGQIAKIKSETRLNIKFLSGDTNPVHLAKGLGIDAEFPDESWLLPADPNPHDKKIREYEAKIKLLESQLPTIEVVVDFEPSPLEFYEIEPPSEGQLIDLIKRHWLTDAAMHSTPAISFNLQSGKRVISKEDIDRYNFKMRRDSKDIHKRSSLVRNQFFANVCIENSGKIAAEDLRIEFACSGVKFSENLYFDVGWPPRKPDPNRYRPQASIQPVPLPQFMDQERVDFEIDEVDPSRAILTCKMFRQARSFSFLIFGAMEVNSSPVLSVKSATSCRNGSGVQDILHETPLTTRFQTFESAFDLEKGNARLTDKVELYVRKKIAKGDFSNLTFFEGEE